MAYVINPTPQTGSGIFGQVPGVLGLPNPSSDLAAQYPNLAGTNQAVSGDIMSQLQGQLSPATMAQMQDYDASFSAGQGMPGSNAVLGSLTNNMGARNIGLTAEQLQQQGIANYNQTIPTISGTQTVSPALQTEVAATNALNASAPNPTQAGNYAQQMFQQYLNSMKSPAGGTVSGMPSNTLGIQTGLNPTQGNNYQNEIYSNLGWGAVGSLGNDFAGQGSFGLGMGDMSGLDFLGGDYNMMDDNFNYSGV